MDRQHGAGKGQGGACDGSADPSHSTGHATARVLHRSNVRRRRATVPPVLSGAGGVFHVPSCPRPWGFGGGMCVKEEGPEVGRGTDPVTALQVASALALGSTLP